MTDTTKPVVPGEGRPDTKRALWDLLSAYENAHRHGNTVPGVVSKETTTFWKLHDEFLAAVARPALPAPEPPRRDYCAACGTPWIQHSAACVKEMPRFARAAEHAPPEPSAEATLAFEQAYLGTMGLSPGFQMNHVAVRDGLEAAYAVDRGSRPALAGSPEQIIEIDEDGKVHGDTRGVVRDPEGTYE